MRKVIYSMFVSLDGFIAGPNRELDWHIIDEELHRFVNDQERAIGTYLYGRRMYEVMSYWQTADTNPSSPAHVIEYACIWQSIPKIVFSKTLKQVGPNAKLVEDNIAEEIAKLKEQPGKNMALGGASIASTFMRLSLIDEYQIALNPVVLGKGRTMFDGIKEKLTLKLTKTRTFGNGNVMLCYEPMA